MIALQYSPTALLALRCTLGSPKRTSKIWRWMGVVTEEGRVQHDGGAGCNGITI
jgi:hypothetical protein